MVNLTSRQTWTSWYAPTNVNNSKYVPTHTSKHTIIAVAESNTNTMPNLISMYVTTLGISKCVMAAST